MTFAVDTNVLAFPTQRRLVFGVALALNTPIVLLPEVERELTSRTLVVAEKVRIKRIAKIDIDDLPPGVRSTLRQKLKDQTNRWWQDIPEGLIQRITFDARQDAKVEAFCESFPKKVFTTGIDRDPFAGDPRIAAQAIVANVMLLGTNNLKTIDHQKINEHLRGHG